MSTMKGKRGYDRKREKAGLKDTNMKQDKDE
jgi:hypothetical protein